MRSATRVVIGEFRWLHTHRYAGVSPIGDGAQIRALLFSRERRSHHSPTAHTCLGRQHERVLDRRGPLLRQAKQRRGRPARSHRCRSKGATPSAWSLQASRSSRPIATQRLFSDGIRAPTVLLLGCDVHVARAGLRPAKRGKRDSGTRSDVRTDVRGVTALQPGQSEAVLAWHKMLVSTQMQDSPIGRVVLLQASTGRPGEVGSSGEQ